MYHNRPHNHNRWTLPQAATAAGAVALLAGVIMVNDHRSETETFLRDYTSEEHCLAGTPYDPLKGAKLYDSGLGLDIVPADANFQPLSVLRLKTHHHGLKSPTFTAADTLTDSYLVEMDCPGARDGGP